ncbi:hypothetical protein IMAU10566_02981 [Lactiplantibacillus plantarum]|nr:hypothetical protein [Lactiplantibacillus plantarum]
MGLNSSMASLAVAELLDIDDIKQAQLNNIEIDPKKVLAAYKQNTKNGLKEPIYSIISNSQNQVIHSVVKHPCPICGNEIKLFEGFRLKDGKICDDCGTKIGLKNDFKSVSVADNLTIQDVKEFQDAHTKIDVKQYLADLKAKEKQAVAKEKQAAFDKKTEYEKLLITFKKEGNGHVGKVYMDNKRQQFLIKQTFTEHLVDTPPTLYNYSDLESYDPIENGTTIEKKHGLSRAIAGGLIAGPTGAALGAFSGNKAYAAVSKVSVVLYFSGDRRVEAVLLNTDTKTDSGEYHAVKQLLLRFCHELDNIIAENK